MMKFRCPGTSGSRWTRGFALFNGYNIDGDREYRDYKKFRTSAKIVGIAEIKDQT